MTENGTKVTHLRRLKITISQTRNKLFTKFERLESTTIHGHMLCVQKTDNGMTNKWGKRDKI